MCDIIGIKTQWVLRLLDYYCTDQLYLAIQVQLCHSSTRSHETWEKKYYISFIATQNTVFEYFAYQCSTLIDCLNTITSLSDPVLTIITEREEHCYLPDER